MSKKYPNKSVSLRKARDSVNNFLEKQSDREKADLIFVFEYGERGELANLGIKKLNLSLEELILRILEEKNNYSSRNNMTKEIETDSERLRSVLDIWRHVKFYLPNTTIFDVMAKLWEIRLEIFTSVCSLINRRVFDCNPEDCSDSFYYNDEFNLIFPDWEDINIQKKGE